MDNMDYESEISEAPSEISYCSEAEVIFRAPTPPVIKILIPKIRNPYFFLRESMLAL